MVEEDHEFPHLPAWLDADFPLFEPLLKADLDPWSLAAVFVVRPLFCGAGVFGVFDPLANNFRRPCGTGPTRRGVGGEFNLEGALSLAAVCGKGECEGARIGT